MLIEHMTLRLVAKMENIELEVFIQLFGFQKIKNVWWLPGDHVKYPDFLQFLRCSRSDKLFFCSAKNAYNFIVGKEYE